MGQTKEDIENKIQALASRADVIPTKIAEFDKKTEDLDKLYRETEKAMEAARDKFNSSKKEANKNRRELGKVKRERNLLRKELNEEIPRQIGYYKRKIKQLENQQKQDTPSVDKKTRDELLTEAARKAGVQL